mmetsp:Transcript_32734/g.101477  ORF Transcript_32734/g.101477 Transcript_32734/m.101477 type:complete len:191 (-) Transcript_32734:76-648(-)
MAAARRRSAVRAMLVAAVVAGAAAVGAATLALAWDVPGAAPWRPCPAARPPPAAQPLPSPTAWARRTVTRRALESSLSRPGGAEAAEDGAAALVSQLLATAETATRKDAIRRFLSEDGERCSELSGAILAYAERRANGEAPDELEAAEASGAIRRIVFETSVIMRKLYGDGRQDFFTEEMEPLSGLLSRF